MQGKIKTCFKDYPAQRNVLAFALVCFDRMLARVWLRGKDTSRRQKSGCLRMISGHFGNLCLVRMQGHIKTFFEDDPVRNKLLSPSLKQCDRILALVQWLGKDQSGEDRGVHESIDSRPFSLFVFGSHAR